MRFYRLTIALVLLTTSSGIFTFTYYDEMTSLVSSISYDPEVLNYAGATLSLALTLTIMSCLLFKIIGEHFSVESRKLYYAMLWLISAPLYLKLLNCLHIILWGKTFTIGVYKILNYFLY